MELVFASESWIHMDSILAMLFFRVLQNLSITSYNANVWNLNKERVDTDMEGYTYLYCFNEKTYWLVSSIIRKEICEEFCIIHDF